MEFNLVGCTPPVESGYSSSRGVGTPPVEEGHAQLKTVESKPRLCAYAAAKGA